MPLRHVILILTMIFVALLYLRREDQTLNTAASQSPSFMPPIPRPYAVSGTLKSTTSSRAPLPKRSYRDLLDQDSFCEVVRTPLHERDHAAQFLQSLGFGADARFFEFAGDTSPYFIDGGKQNYSTLPTRFVQALQLAGELEGGPRAKVTDVPAAWALLSQLNQEDPTNGAYLYFRLGLEQDMDYPLEQRRQTVEGLLRTTEFNTFVADFYHEVLGRMRQNASKVYVGSEFLSSLPVPSYAHATAALRELDFEFPGLAAQVAALITKNGLTAHESYKLGGYLAIEYVVGRTLGPGLGLPALNDLEFSKTPGFDFEDLRMQEGQALEFVDDQGRCIESARNHFYAQLAGWR